MALKRAVYSQSVQSLVSSKTSDGPYYDITALTIQKVRFVDVDAFLDQNLKVRGLDWKGGDGKTNYQDPMNVDVLKQLCTAARKEGCTHLWVDKFCVIQDRATTGNDDQAWQIPLMFKLYQMCHICLVAPGGLGRLPRLEEDTSYLQRLWTLQEALAPPKVKCLFDWNQGDAYIQHNSPMTVEALSTGKAAIAELSQILVASVQGGGELTRSDSNSTGSFVPVHTLATGKDSDSHRLDAAMALLGCKDSDERFSAASVAGTSLWRAMLLRTASYPQDLIFGSMGMFGVEVPPVPAADPSQKYDAKQLAQLLVDFVRRTKDKGYTMQWLGCLLGLPPAVNMTMLPPLPIPGARGGATLLHADGVVKPETFGSMTLNWWLSNAIIPREIADNGDVTFTARACAIKATGTKRQNEEYIPQRDRPDELVCVSDGSVFTLIQEGEDAFAVVAGTREPYPRGEFPLMQTTDTTLLMLLVARDGMLRNVGYAWGDASIAAGWKERSLLAGGAPTSLRGVNISNITVPS